MVNKVLLYVEHYLQTLEKPPWKFVGCIIGALFLEGGCTVHFQLKIYLQHLSKANIQLPKSFYLHAIVMRQTINMLIQRLHWNAASKYQEFVDWLEWIGNGTEPIYHVGDDKMLYIPDDIYIFNEVLGALVDKVYDDMHNNYKLYCRLWSMVNEINSL